MMRRLSLLLLLPAGLGSTLPAQTSVQALQGVLSGQVQDSASGLPVPYALLILVEPNMRVFVGENGRFSLAGLRPGRLTIQVRQIGYRPATLQLQVDGTGGAAAGGSPLLIRMARQPFVLPEIRVMADACVGQAGGEEIEQEGGILREAFTNALRLQTMERSYPFRGAFQRETTVMDAAYVRQQGWVDTLRYDSRQFDEYRKGKVLQRSLGFQGGEHARYFTSSDLATEEFQRSHCFWYAGRDSVEGFPAYKIEFAPAKKVKSPDWAGSMILDSASMTLIRSDARLVNLPRTSLFRTAICTVLYQQVVPTLVLEFQARCISGHATIPPRIVVERWLRIDHAFVGKRPGADTLP